MIRARLRQKGIFVQRERIRKAMGAISNRKPTKRIERRSYYVRAPLSMMHIDGYHKLIRLFPI